MSAFQNVVNRCRVATAESAGWRALRPLRILWREAETSIAAITRPRDSTSADRTTVRTAADSRTGRAVASGVGAVALAWDRSQARRAWSVVLFVLASPVSRIRAAGWCAVVAMSTALAIQLAASRLAPLSWLVPVTVIAAALVAIAAADSVAAALAQRRS